MDKPNVRKMFVPDPGYVLIEGDLKQADAQVVAWEAEDETLMELFARPDVDVHTENAKTAFAVDSISPHMRKVSKSLVHGTNYGGSARTMAKRLGLTVHQATVFQTRWFAAHPKIKKWHEKVQMDLMVHRTTRNILGFRKLWFDRVEGLLPEALAWIPQSTVALTINTGIQNAVHIRGLEPLLQVHDSFLCQCRKVDLERVIEELGSAMRIPLPYPRPLIIGVDFKVSERSWGEMIKWADYSA